MVVRCCCRGLSQSSLVPWQRFDGRSMHVLFSPLGVVRFGCVVANVVVYVNFSR